MNKIVSIAMLAVLVGCQTPIEKSRTTVAACPPADYLLATRRPGVPRVMYIGAHPDDADIVCGGLAVKQVAKGYEVVFVSLTDGRMGHHRLSPEETAKTRYAETREAAKRFGLKDYIVLDNPDCGLVPSVENRIKVAEIIRSFQPDFVITHRVNDYHVDHRATGTLVMDAGYLLGVPHWATNVPAQRLRPVILYMSDPFTVPNELKPDVMVGVDQYLDKWCDGLDAQVCQMYDWLPWDRGNMKDIPDRKDIAARNAYLIKYQAVRKRYDAKRFAAEWKSRNPGATLPEHLEVFEISEYGRAPTMEDIGVFAAEK